MRCPGSPQTVSQDAPGSAQLIMLTRKGHGRRAGLQARPTAADATNARTRCSDRKDRSVIAVTCRNGEHFSVDPDAIERIETHPDITLVLVDGSHYVVEAGFEDLLRAVRDHRAAAFVARNHLVDGYAATPGAVRMSGRPRHHGEAPIHVVHGSDED